MQKAGLQKELSFKRTPEEILQDFARMSGGRFKFRRSRPKHQKYRLHSEPFDIFDTYATLAYEHIHISPIVAKSKRLMSQVPKPKQVMGKKEITKRQFNPLEDADFHNRDAARYVNEWAHKISGVPMKYDAPPRVRKFLNKMNSNLGAAILGASYRAMAVQPLALIGTYSSIGGTYTLKGLYDLPFPSKYRSAKTKSDVLATRSPEVTIAEDLGRLGDLKMSEFPKIARNISFRGLQIMDGLTAHATWNGAYAQAKAGKVPGRRGREMSETEAIRYADDIVVKTQGSGNPGEISPIQYTSWGKTATMFQTFVINNWNYLTQEAMGLSPNTTIKSALPKALRYVAAVTGANYVFEDLAGMKSPMGRPIKAIEEGLEEGTNAFEIAMDFAGELLEPAPVVSGARYGSSLFGPLVQRIGDITTGGKYGLNPKVEIGKAIDIGRFPDKTAQLAMDLSGVPGTGQAFKIYRGLKRGETPYGAIAGTYSKDRKGSSRGGRSSLR
ncbi:MAG: hypothetical protein HKM92_02785 [Arenibacter sp.]|nr:hypothetical protein [Arenibacter sp.]